MPAPRRTLGVRCSSSAQALPPVLVSLLGVAHGHRELLALGAA